MLKMRLQRVGRRNDPSFRIIVTESTRGPKAGVYVDLIGSYNASHGKPVIDTDKAKLWLSRGVQVSDTVHNLLVDAKVLDAKKVNALPKKTAPQKEVEEAPAPEVKAEEAAAEKAEG